MLVSAACFGMTGAVTRRGVLYAPAFAGNLVSIYVSLPLLVVVALGTGQLLSPELLTLKAYLSLLCIGVLNYCVGRWANFRSVEYIGANRSSPIRGTAPIFAATLGLGFLGETLTASETIGVALLIGAPFLVLLGGRQRLAQRGDLIPDRQAKMARRVVVIGAVFAFISAGAYGSSQFLIRMVVGDTGMPTMAALVTNIGACAFLLGLMSRGAQRREITGINRTGLRWFVASGVFVTGAVIFRFAALERMPVTMVSALNETSVFFGLLFNYIINRQVEAWGPAVFAAIGISVIGTMAITL